MEPKSFIQEKVELIAAEVASTEIGHCIKKQEK